MTSRQYVRLSQIQEVWESFSGWYWFVTEYHEDTLVFGLVRGWETEWGYFDLAELRELERESKVWKVPRKNWAVCPCVVDDDAVLCSRLKVGAEGCPFAGREDHEGGEKMSEGCDFSCCGQPMRCLGLVDFLAPEVESVRRWLCPVCGHGVDLMHFDLDAAELRNELELYGDEESPPHTQQVKGGGWTMANENNNNKDTATLVPTKAGRGYKVVVDGVWFYAAKEHLQDVVNGKAKACTFSTIKDEEVVAQ